MFFRSRTTWSKLHFSDFEWRFFICFSSMLRKFWVSSARWGRILPESEERIEKYLDTDENEMRQNLDFWKFRFWGKKKILDQRSKTSRDGLPWASGAPGTSLGVISSSSSSSSSSSLVKLEDVKTFYARAGASAFSAVRFPARWKRISSSNFVFGLFRSCREDNSAENKPWISIRAFDTAENEFPKV